MANNIEIKASVQDWANLLMTAECLAGKAPVVIKQRDTFFNTDTGRLKLREVDDGSAELISYQRENRTEPVPSNYLIYKTSTPESLKSTLQMALGIRGIVSKTRYLFLVGRTRIHLDNVENLGQFMELEVVLDSDEDPLVGEQEAKHLMQALSISEQDLISCAYIDLLDDAETTVNT